MRRFVPHYVQRPWAGDRLSSLFGRRDVPAGTGESWELGDFEAFRSCATDGTRVGDLWRSGFLGGSARGPFPLLLKWVDAALPLSIQVHPDANACLRLGRGAPKSEAWLVVHAEPGASLLLGNRPGLTQASLAAAIASGAVPECLRRFCPAAGDMLHVPPGTLHSVGGGFLLLEVQQPSDTTFRVFDVGRQGRPLHIAEALAAVDYDAKPPGPRQDLLESAHFRMQTLAAGSTVAAGPLRILAAFAGAAQVETDRGGHRLARGDVVVCEESDGALRVQAGTLAWISAPM
jgi:mannose-6-phosphate isomerase